VLDIISPCVTFNDFAGSTKSWEWAKDHEEPLHEIGLVRQLPEISVEQKEGETTRVQMHDGSWIVLRALRHDEHKVTSRASALQLLTESQDRDEFLTGLIYVAPERPDFAVIAWVTVCVVSDEAERDRALAIARRRVGMYLLTPTYSQYHRWLGRGELLDRIGSTLESVPEALLRDLVVIGSPDECRAHLRTFADSGVTTLLYEVLPGIGDLHATLEVLAPRTWATSDRKSPSGSRQSGETG
jgi:hypothetical protein